MTGWDRIVRNTYKTLMSRGMKGCYVYVTNQELKTAILGRLLSTQSSRLQWQTLIKREFNESQQEMKQHSAMLARR
ncbi:DNA/RNA helicase domain-containing protein [Pseudomonas sp. Hp2]|uniref:DNA/RNA helicase domain-containing protein n=1 Tax=Pseudomonas sp. Hp2 TaxID=701189 RepID=UPI003556A421